MQNVRLCLILALATLILPSAASAAWWNKDWGYRREVKLDMSATGANIPGSPTDVPVLIRLHSGNFGFFADVQPDGDDLRFVASDDVTPLKFHVERFDPVNQMALLWVRIPRLTGGTSSDFIYMYYGNPGAAGGGDAPGTYDTNQVLVYHFSDANGIAGDSTAYRNAPAQFGAKLAPASFIAGGATFDGTGSIAIAESPTMRVLADRGITISAWLKIEAPQQDAYVVSTQDSTGRALVLGLNGASPYVRLATSAGARPPLTGPDISLGEWHHLALRAGEGRLSLFVDGAEAAGEDAVLEEIASPLVIGQSAAGANAFIGELDELEVSNSVRSADWLKAASDSQGMTSKLVDPFGADSRRDSTEGEGESYFKTTLRNVTVDGWAVIGVLMVMFVISVFVIIGKTVLVSRVDRENRRFLAAYRRMGTGDPLALASGAKEDAKLDDDESVKEELSGHSYRPSTIFPLYLAGVIEVRHRLQSPAVGAQRRGFSAETIGAIRATVDAAFVREQQKLNNKMVLLTIAISGGPFLGLLGTVVGVMITFAAIAASGDVNINAIAPGIAAALVATVAGLGVAIPAMFAYNWLGSRISAIDAETHVFADEFVNKLAERYV
jgi:biopolymer transport protein ExbB